MMTVSQPAEDSPVLTTLRTLRQSTLELSEQRRTLELTLDAKMSQLEALGCDLETPLVDREGFPRADINVYEVRGLRAELVRLRNDWKTVTTRLESLLHQYHHLLREHPDLAAQLDAAQPRAAARPSSAATDLPFARVQAVTAGSPAAEDGLREGDLVLAAGTARGRGAFSQIPQQVTEGRALRFSVQRGAARVDVDVTPRRWEGRGLLGCHLVPV